ncbi:hypothetical protein [Frigoriglobus tundricola]|uniref:Carboxypeptidase regulatory-like domain-containing protein n=1 Tax=Frigoriglobus tundricola TaxID=2774151 RepID=A0A6M5YUE8_9BACT|nr:hypothetical protein [Frigoriglobus tundricola]QJW97705.1 hypothetical protein FTUN_5282 [Frigoriglobus tundricola]
MQHKVRFGAAVLLGTVCAALTSCGYGVREQRLPETGATLEGTVSYGGETVPLALIIVAGSNASATGNIDDSTGRFSIQNVPLGEVKIGINIDAAKGELQGKLMSGYYQGPDAKKKGIVAPPKVVNVPKKYADPNTSGLTTTISAGSNTFDIKIPK